MGLAVNDVVLITLRGRCLGQRILLTLTYRVVSASAGDPTVIEDLTVLANLFSNDAEDILSRYLGIMPTNYTFEQARAQKIYPLPRSAFVVSAEEHAGLSDDGAALTANIAGVITMKTDKSGRSQIGNKHIGPIATAGAANGLLIPALQTDFGDLAVALKEPISPAGGPQIEPVIYHKNGDGPANKFDKITQSQVQNTVRTMRRRTVGLGE